MNEIYKAVNVIKQEAVNSARDYAIKVVASIQKKLEENNFDANLVAPYPSRYASQKQYKTEEAFYRLVNSLVKHINCSYRKGEPRIVEMDPDGIQRFINESIEDAEYQFDAYVHKLNIKIGPVVSAKLTLVGNLWSHSILTVEKFDGVVSNWVTKAIINQSKYSKVFVQFPTRLKK